MGFIFGKGKPIKVYNCAGLQYHFFELTKEQKKQLARIQQRQQAHLLNEDWAGFFGELASMVAIFLVPAGGRQKAMDIAAVREEITDLPYRFICEVLADVHKMGEAAAEAKDR